MTPKRKSEEERLAEQEARRKRVVDATAWAQRYGADIWDADRWMDATDEQWEGRARMARTREAVGIELDVIDLLALSR